MKYKLLVEEEPNIFTDSGEVVEADSSELVDLFALKQAQLGKCVAFEAFSGD